MTKKRRLMMMAASLRKDSVNKKLLDCVEKVAKEKGIEIDHAAFSEFTVPIFNQDDLDANGLPQVIQDFIKRMHAADGLVIASPEYNYSTPGTLKNFIDWVSRDRPMPWDGQHILLMSASPSNIGGNRGLWTTRIPLEGCGAFVYPKMFSLPDAYNAFDEKGAFKDAKNVERIGSHLDGFLNALA